MSQFARQAASGRRRERDSKAVPRGLETQSRTGPGDRPVRLVKIEAMTERKPPGMDFSSWIDQQIEEAAKRGAFDDLPGAGKPLPNRGESDDGLAGCARSCTRKAWASTNCCPPR